MSKKRKPESSSPTPDSKKDGGDEDEYVMDEFGRMVPKRALSRSKSPSPPPSSKRKKPRSSSTSSATNSTATTAEASSAAAAAAARSDSSDSDADYRRGRRRRRSPRRSSPPARLSLDSRRRGSRRRSRSSSPASRKRYRYGASGSPTRSPAARGGRDTSGRSPRDRPPRRGARGPPAASGRRSASPPPFKRRRRTPPRHGPGGHRHRRSRSPIGGDRRYGRGRDRRRDSHRHRRSRSSERMAPPMAVPGARAFFDDHGKTDWFQERYHPEAAHQHLLKQRADVVRRAEWVREVLLREEEVDAETKRAVQLEIANRDATAPEVTAPNGAAEEDKAEDKDEPVKDKIEFPDSALFLGLVSPQAERAKIVSTLSALPGLIKVVITEPLQHRALSRLGWAYFVDSEACKKALEQAHIISQLRELGLGLMPKRMATATGVLAEFGWVGVDGVDQDAATKAVEAVPASERRSHITGIGLSTIDVPRISKGLSVFGPHLPPLALEPARVEHDLEQALALANKLDADWELYSSKASKAAAAADAADEAAVPATPDEVDLKLSHIEGNVLEEVLSGLETPLQKLNVVLFYLQRVHSVAYYLSRRHDSPEALLNASGPSVYARAHPAEPEKTNGEADEEEEEGAETEKSPEQAQGEEWARGVDRTWAHWMGKDDSGRTAKDPKATDPPSKPSMRRARQLLHSLSGFTLRFFDGQINQEAEARFRCSLCTKLFRGRDFVEKHIRNRHGPMLEASILKQAEEESYETFLADPEHPHLLHCAVPAGPHGRFPPRGPPHAFPHAFPPPPMAHGHVAPPYPGFVPPAAPYGFPPYGGPPPVPPPYAGGAYPPAPGPRAPRDDRRRSHRTRDRGREAEEEGGRGRVSYHDVDMVADDGPATIEYAFSLDD